MDATKLQYRALLQEDLEEVRTLMLSSCREIPQPVRQPIEMLINAGGKRLRPALTLLSAYIYGADQAEARLTAAAVELLHTATLIHDDLIDDALVRRGVTTLNAQWDPTASVLAGDLVFALAAKLIAQTRNPTLVQHFAETLETICLGELQQMLSRNGELPSVGAYYARIFAKTASLFSLCMQSGPILAGCAERETDRAARFGTLLGEAFQITDDVLDLLGSPEQLRKPVGSDLRQGLVTLPVLLYAQTADAEPEVLHVLHQPADEVAVSTLLANLQASGAGEMAMAQARARAESALSLVREFTKTPYRHALEEIVHFSVERAY
jgi:geranylgeranyl pyrophosphate synthase